MPKKRKDIEYYETIGRRKGATARVRMYIVSKRDKTVAVGTHVYKQGQIIINGKPSNEYFTAEVDQKSLVKPLELAQSLDRFVISILVDGGGKQGQLDAVVLGISRALCSVDLELRPQLKTEGLLRRDPRVRERRKVGMGGKARRRKQSPKR